MAFPSGFHSFVSLDPDYAIYGWLSPWPQAEQELDLEGVKGIKLLIGAGATSERKSDGSWLEEHQRSFIVLPASLPRMETFIYTESRGSNITGVERRVERSTFASIFLVSLWLLGGWVTLSSSKSWIKKRAEARRNYAQ